MEQRSAPLPDDDVTLRFFIGLEKALASATSLNEYMAFVHDELKQVLHADSMAVVLFDDTLSSLRFEYLHDTQPSRWVQDQVIDTSELTSSPLSFVLDNQHGLLLTKTNKSEEWQGDIPGYNWMSFPLMSDTEECLGVVAVHNYIESSPFRSQEYELMRLVASQISSTICRLRYSEHATQAQLDRTALLERELREKEKAEKLHHTLYQIATLVTKELPLEELYHHFHKIIGELLYANNFFIAMLDQEQKHLTFAYFIDEKDGRETIFKTVEVGRGLTSYVVKKKAAQLLTAQDVKNLIARDEIDEVFGSNEFSCWMGAPLITNNRVQGIVVLQSYDTEVLFTQADLQLLNFVATHIASAIELSVAAQIKRDSQHQLERHHKEISDTLVQLKTTQKELIQKEKMASLGSLVAGVAHEINTPLGICVTGISHLAEEYRQIKKAFDENKLTRTSMIAFFDSIEKATKILTSNTNRAAELVQSFKQVAVDQSSENIRRFELGYYIDEIVLSMRPTFKMQQHVVTVRCPKNIVVNINAGALSQIITNLIMNSIKHGFENRTGGEVLIDVTLVNDRVHLEYQDNGKGVSQKNMTKLFEPFFTTKRGRGGSGLGTHVVYNLVTAALYGDVEANSQLGKGLHYLITFPADSNYN